MDEIKVIKLKQREKYDREIPTYSKYSSNFIICEFLYGQKLVNLDFYGANQNLNVIFFRPTERHVTNTSKCYTGHCFILSLLTTYFGT
jgi:hypothetical protein